MVLLPPVAHFEKAFWMLSSDELLTLGVTYNGLTGSEPIPEQAGVTAFAIVEDWAHAGIIASAYNFISVHKALWDSDAEAWLLAAGIESGEAAEMAAGGIPASRVPPRDGARNSDGLVRCWRPTIGSHEGFIVDPILFWSGSGTPASARVRMVYQTGSDLVISGETTDIAHNAALHAAWMIANRPVGNRGLRLSSFPFERIATLPNGTQIISSVTRWDNYQFGKHQQIFMDDFKEQVAIQWKTWLDAYAAAGGTLDYVVLDTEWDRRVTYLATTGNNPPASYPASTTWYADLKAEAVAEIVTGVPVNVNVGDALTATRGATTISFTCTAGATPTARIANAINGLVAAWNASASGDITPVRACRWGDYATMNSSAKIAFQSVSPAVPIGSSITLGVVESGSPHDLAFNKTVTTRDAETDYRLPDLSNIETWVSFYNDTAWQFCTGVRNPIFEVINYGVWEPLQEVFPDCQLQDYSATPHIPGWYSSGSPAKLYSSPYGYGQYTGTHMGCAFYADNTKSGGPGNQQEAWYPNGVGNVIITASDWTRLNHEYMTWQGMRAATNLPLSPWVCSYTAYTLSAEHAFVYNLFFLMCGEWAAYWNASTSETEGAEDVIEAAAAQAYENMEGALGVPLPMPPRGRWDVADNLNADIEQDWLLNGRILTLTVHNDYTWELSERENVTNIAPVLEAIEDYDALVDEAVTGLSATASDKNTEDTITYSITSGPAWLSIDDETGELSGTPTAPGTVGVTVRATDDGSPVLYDETSFNINVTPGDPTNDPPTINIIGTQSATEGVEFSLTVTGEDPNDDTLTWSLVVFPAGMTIGSSSGTITWTPGETFGGTAVSVTVQATDDGTPNLSTTRGFTINVAEANQAPALAAISNQNVNEHALLTVQCSATDADLPAQALNYSLQTAPSGMLIGATTGTITWTPNETQGSATPYDVTVRVTDAGGLFAERSFTVTVAETNTAPVLGAIGDKFGTETVLLTFTASATDSDVPAQTLTYSLEGSPPAGAMIDSSSGVFTWTPTSEQAGEYMVTVRVTDNGAGNLYDEETITITILDSNQPPVLAAIGNKSATEDILLTFTASATDPDLDDITYSLADAPDGATIDGDTGVFEWTPYAGQGGTSYQVTVFATDNGSPPAADSETITITVTAVNHAPILEAIGNKTVAADGFLGFTLSATDPDGPTTLGFSMSPEPPGALLDQLSGVFTWFPKAANIGEHSVTFYVTDGELTDSETVTITVLAQDAAPRPQRKSKGAAAPAAPWWNFKSTGVLRGE